jgi:biopolymer transport protein ExbB
MLKIIRSAGLAAVLLITIASVVPPIALGQNQPAAPAASPPATAGAAPAATAPVAAGATRSTEVVDNPYGLQALWAGGDIVARITLGILVIMSVRWCVIVTKVYEQAKMGGARGEKPFWKRLGASGHRGLKPGSPYRSSRNPGSRHRLSTRVAGQCRPQHLITMSIQRAIDNVQSRTRIALPFWRP